MSLEGDLKEAIRDACKSREGVDEELARAISPAVEVNGEITEIYAELDALVDLIVQVVSAHEPALNLRFPFWTEG